MPAPPQARAAVGALVLVGVLLVGACSAPPPPLLDHGTEPAPASSVGAAMARLVDEWRSPSGQAAQPAGRYLLTSADSAAGASAVALVYTGESRESWVLEADGRGAAELGISAASRRRWQSATDFGPWAIPLLSTGARFLVSERTDLAVRTAATDEFDVVPAPEAQDVPLPPCEAAAVRLTDDSIRDRPVVRHELWTGREPGATSTPLLTVTEGGEAAAAALLDALRGVDMCAANRGDGLLGQVAALAGTRSTGRPEDAFWVQGVAPLLATDVRIDGRPGRLTVIRWEAGGSGAIITSTVWRPEGGAPVVSAPVRAAELAPMRLALPARPVDVLLELPGLGAVQALRGADVQHDGRYAAPGNPAQLHRVIVYRTTGAAVPVLELAGVDGVREQVVGAP